MTNAQVIQAFAFGNKAHSGSLTSTGDKLFSYNTIIAEFKNNTLYINATKYSVTTSKHQHQLRRTFESWNNKVEVSKIPYNAQSLAN